MGLVEEVEKGKISEVKLDSLCGCRVSERKSEMAPLTPDTTSGRRMSVELGLALSGGTGCKEEEEEEEEEEAMTGALLYVFRTCRPSDGWRTGRDTLISAGMFVREWWWVWPTMGSSLSIISLIMSSSSSSRLSEVEWPRPATGK